LLAHPAAAKPLSLRISILGSLRNQAQNRYSKADIQGFSFINCRL
jgi:hypothetical protein